MVAAYPEIQPEHCLNTRLPDLGKPACTRCLDRCPADAITLNPDHAPQLHASACTGCTGCVPACPADAIGHEALSPVNLLQQARQLVMQGQSEINVACNAITDTRPGLRVHCHASWDPALLACMAAEGVRIMHLEGIDQCDSCPACHGSSLMQQTEKDYATLNKSLGMQLHISRKAKAVVVEKPRPASEPEPQRRAFFRSLIPTLTQGAAMAASQIGQAVNQATAVDMTEADTEHGSHLPVRLQLFLRALPRLQANFTPVPFMPSLPLGAIQANASCTACNQCIEQCPTEALGIREFGANKILEFQPDACTGCRQCINTCPEEALESLPGISLPSVLTRRARPLIMVRGDMLKKEPGRSDRP